MTRISGLFRGLLSKRPLDSNLQFISKYFGFRIKDPRPYHLALVHRSSGKKENNERLELLGDAVLDLVVADYLYSEYPKLNEGELTKLKSKLISRDQLNKIGHNIGMVDHLSLVKQRDLDPSLLIGNVLEAIFGAIYLDQGYQVSHLAGIKMFNNTCDLDDLLENIHDSKSLLLEWSQRRKKNIRFKVTPADQDSFIARIFIDDMLIAQGDGRSKKKAEKAAAKKALEVIEIGD